MSDKVGVTIKRVSTNAPVHLLQKAPSISEASFD